MLMTNLFSQPSSWSSAVENEQKTYTKFAFWLHCFSRVGHVVPLLLSPPCSLSFPLPCFPRLWEQPHTLTQAQLLNAKCGAFPWAPTRWPCGKWMAGFGSQFSLGVTWLSSGNGDTEANCGDCYNSWLLHFSPMLENNAILFNKSKPPSMIFPLIKKLIYKLKFHHHVLWEETLILVIP